MLLMVKKGIRARICHSIYRYTKANNQIHEQASTQPLLSAAISH